MRDINGNNTTRSCLIALWCLLSPPLHEARQRPPRHRMPLRFREVFSIYCVSNGSQVRNLSRRKPVAFTVGFGSLFVSRLHPQWAGRSLIFNVVERRPVKCPAAQKLPSPQVLQSASNQPGFRQVSAGSCCRSTSNRRGLAAQSLVHSTRPFRYSPLPQILPHWEFDTHVVCVPVLKQSSPIRFCRPSRWHYRVSESSGSAMNLIIRE